MLFDDVLAMKSLNLLYQNDKSFIPVETEQRLIRILDEIRVLYKLKKLRRKPFNYRSSKCC